MSSNVVKKTDNKLKKHSCFFSRSMLLDIDFLKLSQEQMRESSNRLIIIKIQIRELLIGFK